MRYYKHLYLMEGLEKKKGRIIRKLEENKFQANIHIITLSQNEKNHLEIYNSVLLLQPDYPHEDFFVVGIAKGYEDAVELVEQIVQEVYNETKGADIRSYILKKEQEDATYSIANLENHRDHNSSNTGDTGIVSLRCSFRADPV